MGGAIPKLVVLGSIRKQVEQAMRNEPVSSMPLWSLHRAPASRILPCLSSCTDILW